MTKKNGAKTPTGSAYLEKALPPRLALQSLLQRVVTKNDQPKGQAAANDIHVPHNQAEALRLGADLEEHATLMLESQQQAEAIASLESLFMVGETPTQLCKPREVRA